jgi:hypothetical protein
VSVARTLLWTRNDKKQMSLRCLCTYLISAMRDRFRSCTRFGPVVILGWAGFGPMDRNEPRIILLYYYIKLYCTQIWVEVPMFPVFYVTVWQCFSNTFDRGPKKTVSCPRGPFYFCSDTLLILLQWYIDNIALGPSRFDRFNVQKNYLKCCRRKTAYSAFYVHQINQPMRTVFLVSGSFRQLLNFLPSPIARQCPTRGGARNSRRGGEWGTKSPSSRTDDQGGGGQIEISGTAKSTWDSNLSWNHPRPSSNPDHNSTNPKLTSTNPRST